MDPMGILVAAVLFLGAEIAKKSADDLATGAWTRIKGAFRQTLGHDPVPSEIDESAVRKVMEQSTDVGTELEHVASQSSSLRRAAITVKALAGAKILWIDDNPSGNAWERHLLTQFGVLFVTVESTSSGLSCLRQEHFDLVLSDIARGDTPEAGLDGLRNILEEAPGIPVIFYVGYLAPDRPTPIGSKGIAADPNELLHLVLDQLERGRL